MTTEQQRPERLLKFGLNQHNFPDGLDAVWGARLIYPDDLLYDRQDFYGIDTLSGTILKSHLNGECSCFPGRGQGAISAALQEARRRADAWELPRGSSEEVFTLYEDDIVVIKASPQGSHGYLYVAAWLKVDAEPTEGHGG